MHPSNNQDCPKDGVPDPFSPSQPNMCEAVEWALNLVAPDNAKSFSFDYIFFSTEYDEYVGSKYNDRFYVLLEADSTNQGARTVINFTKCRNSFTNGDFTCSEDMTGCTIGETYCYIAVNTALSECCWLGDCSADQPRTDITGTGFECAPEAEDECSVVRPDGTCEFEEQNGGGVSYGSSTGWLRTVWNIEPGESFRLTFHIHDTADSKFDSEVILDNFKFRTKTTKPGTGHIE
jgi:hypothetical protein